MKKEEMRSQLFTVVMAMDLQDQEILFIEAENNNDKIKIAMSLIDAQSELRPGVKIGILCANDPDSLKKCRNFYMVDTMTIEDIKDECAYDMIIAMDGDTIASSILWKSIGNVSLVDKKIILVGEYTDLFEKCSAEHIAWIPKVELPYTDLDISLPIKEAEKEMDRLRERLEIAKKIAKNQTI